MSETNNTSERTTIVMHSGDMDKFYSALIIGNGALAMGMEVSIYFTFWGLERLKKGGLNKGPLSKMHLLGLGKWMVAQSMLLGRGREVLPSGDLRASSLRRSTRSRTPISTSPSPAGPPRRNGFRRAEPT